MGDWCIYHASDESALKKLWISDFRTLNPHLYAPFIESGALITNSLFLLLRISMVRQL